MKMTFTNREMASALDIMMSARETGKLALALARNSRMMKDSCKEYLDLRTKAFEKYGTVNKATGQATVTGENVQKVQDELKDVADIELEVDILQVSADDFENSKLTNQQMEALLWMIKED